jgi:uncharacterized repeat protein (TIGR03843 family)
MSEIKEILVNGELIVTGRLIDASNATLLAECSYMNRKIKCIYKPIAGERPLWDFPDGNLANREYAAFLISDHADFDVVPITILREGPFGSGMVQEWIDIDTSIDLGTFFSSDDPRLREMALFDAVINNTDRKIGHLLPHADGSLYGCDHGVTFHQDNKLRTVLWQWAGDALSEKELQTLKDLLNKVNNQQVENLQELITDVELAALIVRIENLLASKSFPLPSQEWPAIPWPAF